MLCISKLNLPISVLSKLKSKLKLALQGLMLWGIWVKTVPVELI